MPKAKSYMNPNIPKPKPRTSGPEKEERKVYKPMEPLPRRKPGAPDKREKRPLPRLITGNPPKKEKRPLPKPINKSGMKKDGPSGKKGSLPFNPKKPILLRPIRTKSSR